MMPLGAVGGCQISRTDVVLTSGNRMPTGGPGTEGTKEKQVAVQRLSPKPSPVPAGQVGEVVGQGPRS